MTRRKVLITGAAGYLAAFVIRRLRERFELRLTDRVAPGEEFAGLPFLLADVTNYEEMERVVAGQDAVVHLAALVSGREMMPPTAFADVMVKGFWNIAQACVAQKAARLVNISSVMAGGWPDPQGRALRADAPPSFVATDLPYSLAKHLAEEIGNAYHQAHGLSVIHLRPGIIGGANPEPKEGQGAVSFMHVDPRDVAQAVEAALDADITFGVFNIVAGRADTRYDWQDSRKALGFQPAHNWPEVPTV